MNTYIRIYIAICVTMIMLMMAWGSEAGPFLDLDIGTHLTDWSPTCPECENRYLGEESPIAIVRIGYQTETYPLWGPVDISAHGYYEHMSSAGNPNDHGVDVLMFGIRIE